MLQTKPELITFQVDDVTPATALLAECRMHEAVRTLLGTDIEACNDYHGSVVKEVYYHGLLAAVYAAFSDHRPLVLSPDMIWLTITQGVAQHMAVHAERLRPNFVAHEGRQLLQVSIDDFIKGSPENPWPRAFADWSTLIRRHVGAELHDQLVCRFSTTGPIERTASEIVLMDIFERYFYYVAMCICGIPEITLEGTTEDWVQLRERVEGLKVFEMDWWLAPLRVIADEFVNAARGNVNRKHWQGICKRKDAYGGQIINGWIAKLFPYLRVHEGGPVRRRNPIFETGEGFQTSYAPSGLSQVPFVWIIDRPGEAVQRFDMEAIGGFTGVAQDGGTRALRPRIGWAVREVSKGDALCSRLAREHTVFPGRSAALNADQLDPVLCQFSFPASLPQEMGRFFFATNGARLFEAGGGARFRFLPYDEMGRVQDPALAKDVRALLGNVPAQWCRFCELADGRWAAIDLRQRVVRADGRVSSFVIVCGADRTHESPVVAESFEEFLEQALHSHGTYWWEQPGFRSLGDGVMRQVKVVAPVDPMRPFGF